jgi:hypothetical protein
MHSVGMISFVIPAYDEEAGHFYFGGNYGFTDGNESTGKLQDDWDPIVGLGMQYRLFGQVRARVEYERYFLRETDIDMSSVGLTVGF